MNAQGSKAPIPLASIVASARYIDVIQPCFDTIQQSIGWLAGLLVQVELTRSKMVIDLDTREIRLRTRDEARGVLRTICPPGAAAHFHHHLTNAFERLDVAWEAFEERRVGLVGAADPLVPLRSAWDELEAASRMLPGFDTVDFRSCCAVHLGSRSTQT